MAPAAGLTASLAQVATTAAAPAPAPLHPGKILERELAIAGLNQTQFARLAGITITAISYVITGERRITPRTAVALERGFPHIPAERWLAAWAAYELHQLRCGQPP